VKHEHIFTDKPSFDAILEQQVRREVEEIDRLSFQIRAEYSLRQVTDLQREMHEVALLVAKDAKDTTKPEERARAASALADLGKSWNTLQDAKRVILGRSLPGSLRSEKAKLKNSVRPRPLFTE
jgi:hypothetical protein